MIQARGVRVGFHSKTSDKSSRSDVGSCRFGPTQNLQPLRARRSSKLSISTIKVLRPHAMSKTESQETGRKKKGKKEGLDILVTAKQSNILTQALSHTSHQTKLRESHSDPDAARYAILSVNSSRTPATPTAASLSTCPPPRRRLLLCASESSSWPARISRP